MMPCSAVTSYNLSDIEDLEKKAIKLASATKTTLAAGNSVILFTMLLLEEILEKLALDPITNLDSIITIANTLTSLNSSLRTS